MAERLSWGRHYLMAEPNHFDVTYHINPWMRPGVDTAAAVAQWRELVRTLERLGAQVEVTPDVEALPDMAFAMNAGFVHGGRAVVSRFRHAERQPEEPHWAKALAGLGLELVELDAPDEARFEAGDAFVVGDALIGGWGFRSDRAGVAAVADAVAHPLLPLRLVDPRFYHLDTCFCPVREGVALAYLDALAPEDREALRAQVEHLVELSEAEALTFVANSLVVGDTFVTASCPPRVACELATVGLVPCEVDVSQFHLSGGSVRCLTLPLDLGATDPPSAGWADDRTVGADRAVAS